uniref:death domain-containing protein 1-like isoform X1 n=2 Tax=Pristiophorus japonicus TaxID=55135 RepID=UPI00398F584C
MTGPRSFPCPVAIQIPCPPSSCSTYRCAEREGDRSTKRSHVILLTMMNSKKKRMYNNEHLHLLCQNTPLEPWTCITNIKLEEKIGSVVFELRKPQGRLIILRTMSENKTRLQNAASILENALRMKQFCIVVGKGADQPNVFCIQLCPLEVADDMMRRMQQNGYGGPPDPISSKLLLLGEGQEVYIKFSKNGNITTSEEIQQKQIITFHYHHPNKLQIHVKEKDQYANYSYDCYKGLVEFYTHNPTSNNEEVLLCKLPIAIPKTQCKIKGSMGCYRSLIKEEGLLGMKTLRWLASELKNADEELSKRLNIKQSRMQAIKLKYPQNVNEQIIDIIVCWRNGQPRFTDKVAILAAELTKCKRQDLAEVLQQMKTEYSVKDN